jgi:hypothetical protein
MLHCGFCAYTDVAVLACMQWLPAGVIDFGHHATELVLATYGVIWRSQPELLEMSIKMPS